MLKITPILCRPHEMDNYAYLLQDLETGASAILDASEAEPVVAECEKQNIKPDFLLVTHHHFDHVEGNLALKEKYGAKIVGAKADAERIAEIDITLCDGDEFFLGKAKAKIISADGHTIGHILWYFPEEKALFTGDTLFNLCIGGLFEGTIEQMWHSLQKIKELPDDVLFYPGHEYTIYGVRSLCGETGEKYRQKALSRLQKGLPAGPMTLGEEKICNPYLQAESLEEFAQLMG
ncbi:MAG: MBL fold metallo-hydrolase [Alphaproteobacteria bacterium]|nr:MBL fold metallo-hydrolase [Alphaproteobacteria bacterium]